MPVYATSTSAVGFTCRIPARKPTSNLRMSGSCIPPTNPTFPRVSSPASAPARKLPSFSRKTTARTLGTVVGLPLASSTGLSMSRNFALGLRALTARTAGSIMKPTAITSSAP